MRKSICRSFDPAAKSCPIRRQRPALLNVSFMLLKELREVTVQSVFLLWVISFSCTRQA